jgi:hypothetical protein
MQILLGIILCCLGVYAVVRHAIVLAIFWFVVAGFVFWRAWKVRRSGDRTP